MSAPPTPTRFEPEVLALLDEIARSPEGRLLRVPRERLRSYFGDPKEILTPHGSFQSRAERHLITRYREQAARVLLEACHARLQQDQQVVTTAHHDEEALRERARVLSAQLSTDFAGTQDPLLHLSGLSATELAVASARLDPRDAALNALAVCYQSEGWLQSSLRVLATFFDLAVSSEQRADAFSNMARAHSLQGQFSRAVDFRMQACTFDHRRSRLAAWGMVDAIQAGSEERALACSRLLEERASDGGVPGVLQFLDAGRSRARWQPTREARDLCLRLRNALPTVSGALCDAFTSK